MHFLTDFVFDIIGSVFGRGKVSRKANRSDVLWSLILLLFIVLVLIPGYIVKRAFRNSDILSGRTAVESYRNANIIAVVILAVVLLLWLGALVLALARPPLGGYKLFTLICSFAVIAFVGVFRVTVLAKICNELKNPTTTAPEEYIITEKEKDGTKYYYICFEDGGDYSMIAVPKEDHDVFEAKGTPKKDLGSDLFKMVENAGYEDPQLYANTDGSVTVEYYFNSAIYIGMEEK